jgi:hypothetical protein
MIPFDLDRLDPEARYEYIVLQDRFSREYVLTQKERDTLLKYEAFLSTPVE